MAGAPDLSVIIPFERGHQHLVAALDGFVRQSIPIARIEILLVMPPAVRAPLPAALRRLRVRRIKWPRRLSIASAINAGARAARGRVLVMTDARWRPLPGLAAAALVFHDRYPGAADTLALTTSLEASTTDDALRWWLDQQRLAGLSSLSSGVHSWRGLRFDALSAKTELLRKHPLPAGENDEWLIKERWASQAPIRVFVDPAPVLTTSGRADLAETLSTEYHAAYARLHAMRASSQTFANEHVDDRFQHPEKYLIARDDWRELQDTISEMTLELAGRNPRFAIGAEAGHFEVLGKLYMVAVSHARAAGWSDAKAGRAARPAFGK